MAVAVAVGVQVLPGNPQGVFVDVKAGVTVEVEVFVGVGVIVGVKVFVGV